MSDIKINSLIVAVLLFCGCRQSFFKNDYEDNSPTSGKLKVYYDEGMDLHIKNQAYTFESQYPAAQLELFQAAENETVKLMYDDSCKAIVISRPLNEKEKEAFASKQLYPKFSKIAYSGIALITNNATATDSLSVEELQSMLTRDSGNVPISFLLDKSNSSVTHYIRDSVLKGKKFSSRVSAAGSSIEAIYYVAKNKNTIALIDFAWLSDRDDSIRKANSRLIKFVGVYTGGRAEYPSQTSFKLGTYPFTRTVYFYRRSGEFSLGKGFESFVAGPSGQTIFLKQGLLPARQQERSIKVNFEAMQPATD